MLKKNILDKLNAQVNLEHLSSNLYLAMASWCQFKGLEGSAAFLTDHSQEELQHMLKLFDYINNTGSMAIVGPVSAVQTEFKDINDVFQKTFEHEQMITQKINELVDLALTEKDFSTFNFLQWYVSEQHEEEALFKRILDKIDVIGLDGRGLHLVDQEIGRLILKK
jgi:ferritin